jgi:DNA-binding NarL/FixJ family response regulator
MHFTRKGVEKLKWRIISNTREGDAGMGRIVAMMDDLFFQMKIRETAKHLGLELQVATNGDALLKLLDPAPKLVIVDLNARSQPLLAIERVRAAQRDLKVVGFLSHIQRDLAAQAQAAGCNEVMPRSAFTENLAAILSSAKD